jgi:VIT1/CCC1 family predicted Fe2+/Mn2+ transporter
MPSTNPIQRFRSNWQDEVDSAAQYHAMAMSEPDEAVARVYRELAAVEEKHAAFWEDQLRKNGIEVGPRKPSRRSRVLSWIAQRFGAQLILATVSTNEYKNRNDYLHQPETTGTRMSSQERTHARVLQSLLNRSIGAPGNELARIEGRHRNVGGNALRAAVLGTNDGLCSNLSLVMGVAGATANERFILLSGMAGLLAGAFSMALGEWVSVTSSRELAAREMDVERDELVFAPEEEREELQLIYEAKGLNSDMAKQLSQRLVDDPRNALDVLTREELGLDPQELGGSARVAALTSFLLFGLGTSITIFTGRPAWISGCRQLLLGLAAAGVTFALGRVFGVALG